MRVTDADKAFPAEAAHLIGVVRDNMHLLNQVHLGYATPKFWVDVVKLIPEELFWSLLFRKEVSPRRDHPDADDILIEWNEPGPVKFLRVEDQCIVPRGFARNT